MNENTNTLSSHPLDRLYDRGYFHGEGSGYNSEGYQNEHADWSALLNLMREESAGSIRWLDIGCAFGYLIEQAEQRDIEAYGVDISSYALRQSSKAQGKLSMTNAEALPFPDDSFDVVSCFDLVEHLSNPALVIEEAQRVLKPYGILLISTPDPIHFNREEPTHVHERPPSYWVHLLERMGFDAALRFGGRPYEIELLAANEGNERWESLSRKFRRLPTPDAEWIVSDNERLFFAPRNPHFDRKIEKRFASLFPESFQYATAPYDLHANIR